ncbi:MAG: glycosyltransferase [Pedobacter sp.]|nr:MAG: glycosyltransferase [Pedobacter sp.]
MALFGIWELYFTCFRHAKLRAFENETCFTGGESKPISVIISARNEATNLEAFLPAILTQNYPVFEVIVVNDRSWDNTEEVLKSLCLNYANLKVVTITHNDKFIAGKKFALSMGIKAAKYDWLVFTDADCLVNSENWLSYMQDPADGKTEIKLGYSPYFKKSSFLNLMIRYETFYTAVNYLAFALTRNPYMGVGRNMAYNKSLFFKSKGFASHMHIPSGDDDLFINQNANSHNTQIVIAPESHVWSAPKLKLIDYIRQKKRHRGAGTSYKGKHRLTITIQFLLPFIFFALTIIGICFEPTRYFALAALGFVYLIKAYVYPRLYTKLSYGELKWFFPILDILYLCFLLWTGFIGFFIKKGQWK